MTTKRNEEKVKPAQSGLTSKPRYRVFHYPAGEIPSNRVLFLCAFSEDIIVKDQKDGSSIIAIPARK